MTNLEIIEKAARELFGAKTPEEIERCVKLIVFLLKG